MCHALTFIDVCTVSDSVVVWTTQYVLPVPCQTKYIVSIYNICRRGTVLTSVVVWTTEGKDLRWGSNVLHTARVHVTSQHVYH